MERLFVFCTGMLLAACQSQLLYPYQTPVIFIVVGVFLLVCFRFRHLRASIVTGLFLAAGFLYFDFHAGRQLESQIPLELEKQPILVEVTVDDLPVSKNGYWQATVNVQHTASNPMGWHASRLLLTWPKGLRPEPCSQWNVEASLKRPRSLSNPGVFDYALFLHVRGIEAKGYIRKAYWVADSSRCIHEFRRQWQEKALAAMPNTAGWLLALTSGDKSQLSQSQYQLLTQTGIAHLFVISGLHISLVAMAVYMTIGFLRKVGLGLLFNRDWRPFAMLVALVVSGGYVLFAGGQIAAVRAWLMLAVFLMPGMLPLEWSLWHRYWIAMTLLLLLNPLALLSTGFQLSFLAVAVLVLSIERLPARSQVCWYHKCLDACRIQWYLSLGMMPLVVAYFGQIASLGILFNAVAIPFATLFLVPLGLLAVVLSFLGLELQWIYTVLDNSLGTFFGLVESLQSHLGRALHSPELVFRIAHYPWLLAYAITWIILLRGKLQLPGYGLAIILLFAAKIPAMEENKLEVHALDVGQGLAVLVRTQHHNLLYDTGSSWPDNSMADLVVMPVLNRLGIFELDALMVSHNDNDHAGGVQRIMSQMPVSRLYQNDALNALSEPCQAGEQWVWDDVSFKVLHPAHEAKHESRNNRSCVLMIETDDQMVLLAGDIEKSVEIGLVRRGLPELDLLIAPHHGSQTSSSFPLVRKTSKGHVVFSSGYLNRFNHPHPKIVQRYQDLGAKIHHTALHGMSSFYFSANNPVQYRHWRQEKTRFWNKN